MSLTNPNTPVSQQDLQDFYHKLLPYMGGSFGMIANKFSKGDMYSTDEKMIGQWTDGKPLYQKTYLSITISGSTGRSYKNVVDLSSLSIDTFVDAWGRWNDNATSKSYSMADQNQRQSLTYNSSTGYLQLLQYDGTSTMAGWVTVVYTKTTDSAISIGDDTDYSTEEKIVGTWIDGKPIYQKTFSTNFVLPASSEDWVDTGISAITNSIDTIISSVGIRTGNYSGACFFDQTIVLNNTVQVIGHGGHTIGYLTIQYTKTS